MKSHSQPLQGTKAFARAHGLAGQLTRAAIQASVLAVFVAAFAIVTIFYGWSHSKLLSDTEVQAGIAADNAQAAVVFGDRRAAVETLSYLRGSPEFCSAAILDKKGNIFARYDPAANAPMCDKSALVEISKPITQAGVVLGRVKLTVSRTPMYARFKWLAVSTLIAAGIGVLFALLRVKRVRRDVSKTEDDLDRLAFYDQVTGLYNRHAAKEMLEEYVASSQTPVFSIALLDLDDFKLVNDTLGHKAGDDLLRNLGARLRELAGVDGTVFRLGGDEFVVIWHRCGEGAKREALGRRMVQTLSEPLPVGDRVMFAKASIGFATYPEHGESAQELLRAADTAMYCAKSAGKNTYAVYDPAMAEATAQRLQTSTELALALERDELALHYQPIVDVRTRELIGVEALVRWPHPQRGLLSAAQFIDIAEESGLVAELGGWVLKAAARQQEAWAAQGLGHLFIAVNVSAQQFKRNLLLGQVQAALSETRADPKRLQVELTEHTLIEDVDSNVQSLRVLQNLGLAIAIDDFGTGLSSLAYLKRLPIDKLKIDRSFVNDVAKTDEDRAIVSAIVSLAHALKLEVVAEGIESEDQLELLDRLDVDHGQGYYFSRPVHAEAVASMAKGFAALPRAA